MSRVTLLVIPSEVEESLTFCLSSIRDVSTSLDMTMNGQHESDLPFSGNRRHRVPLLLRGARGRFRLHRGDDPPRTVDRNHPADSIAINILVVLIPSFQFWQAGHFSWKLFWPFALLSVPGAYFGGYLQLPAQVLKIIIGLVLPLSAARLFFRRGDPPAVAPHPCLPRSRWVQATGSSPV